MINNDAIIIPVSPRGIFHNDCGCSAITFNYCRMFFTIRNDFLIARCNTGFGYDKTYIRSLFRPYIF